MNVQNCKYIHVRDYDNLFLDCPFGFDNNFIISLEDTSSRNKSLNSFWGLHFQPLTNTDSRFFICESHWRLFDPTISSKKLMRSKIRLKSEKVPCASC